MISFDFILIQRAFMLHEREANGYDNRPPLLLQPLTYDWRGVRSDFNLDDIRILNDPGQNSAFDSRPFSRPTTILFHHTD